MVASVDVVSAPDPEWVVASQIHKQIGAVLLCLNRHDFGAAMSSLKHIVSFNQAAQMYPLLEGDAVRELPSDRLSMRELVARMWQVSQSGLRDGDHPSDCALKLVQRLVTAYNPAHPANQQFLVGNGGALADLLSVLAHPDSALQPSGVAVLREVKRIQPAHTPVIVVSGEHTFGGVAGPCLARELFGAKLITSPALAKVYPLSVVPSEAAGADYFQLHDKSKAKEWVFPLVRLYERLQKRGGTPQRILLVDDAQAAIKEAQIVGAIKKAFPGVGIVLATSFKDAADWLRTSSFDAVVTDMFFPASEEGAESGGADVKTLGIEQLCWILRHRVPRQEVKSWVEEARKLQSEQFSDMLRLFACLVARAHEVLYARPEQVAADLSLHGN